jgi:hypothetical protein
LSRFSSRFQDGCLIHYVRSDGLMRCYAQGDTIDTRELQKASPVELTSVRDYAQSLFAA